MEACLRSVIARIEVGDRKVRVSGDRTVLAAAAIGQNTGYQKVRGLVRNWRASRNKAANIYTFEIAA